MKYNKDWGPVQTLANEHYLLIQKRTLEPNDKLEEKILDLRNEIVLKSTGFILRIAREILGLDDELKVRAKYAKGQSRVRRVYNTKIECDDLVSAGQTRLLEALENYEPKRAKISTYIHLVARQKMRQAALQERGIVKFPSEFGRKVVDAVRGCTTRDDSIERIEGELKTGTRENGLDPRSAELVYRCLGDSHHTLEDTLPGTDLSYGTILASHYPSPETIVVEEDFERKRTQYVDQLLKRLPKRQRSAFEMRERTRDGEEPSFQEIGEQIGCSGENARTLHRRAIRNLQQIASREWLQ